MKNFEKYTSAEKRYKVIFHKDFNLIEINLEKKVVKSFISRNFSYSEHSSYVIICIHDILNLKEFRIFKG